MKVKVKPGRSRVVVTFKKKELLLIHLALIGVYTSKLYSEENKDLAVRMRSKLPLNIEATNDF